VDKGIIIINGRKNYFEFQKLFPLPEKHWDGKSPIKPWMPFGMRCIYVDDYEGIKNGISSHLHTEL